MFIFVLILLYQYHIKEFHFYSQIGLRMLYGLYLRMLYICCVNKTLYDIVKPNQTK